MDAYGLLCEFLRRTSKAVVLVLTAIWSTTSYTAECDPIDVGTESLPGPFSLIGQVIDATREVPPIKWHCTSEECHFADASGVELGALLGPSQRIEIFVATASLSTSKKADLPFALTFNDSMWHVVQMLTSVRGSPSLGVFRRATGETVVTTDNCLRFPSGVIGALTIYFDDAGHVKSLELTVPWEGE